MISADLVAETCPGAARAMLEKRRARGPRRTGFQPTASSRRLRFEIDPAWQGEIPRTHLWSRRDGTVTTIEGSAEMPDLENEVCSSKKARGEE